MEDRQRIFWNFIKSVETKTHCPFSPCCARLCWATININRIIFEINISSIGHKMSSSLYLTVLSYWLELLWHDLISIWTFLHYSLSKKTYLVFWIEFTQISNENCIYMLDINKLMLHNLPLWSYMLQLKELKDQPYFLLKDFQIYISWILSVFSTYDFLSFPTRQFNLFIEVTPMN